MVLLATKVIKELRVLLVVLLDLKVKKELRVLLVDLLGLVVLVVQSDP